MRFSIICLLIATLCFAQVHHDKIVTISKQSYQDDTNLFQNALDTKGGKTLKINVKKGFYKINSNLLTSRINTSLIFDSGAILYFSNENNSGFTVLHDNFLLDGATIEGNSVSSTNFYRGYGVLLNGVSGCIVKNCNFKNISGNNILFFPKSTTGGCNNNFVLNNNFSQPAFDLETGGDESAIMLGYSGVGYKHNNNVVKNNKIDCNFKLKIGIGMIAHGKNNLFENNTISNCRNYGIILYESIAKDSTLHDNIVRLNTIKNIGEVGLKKTVKGMGIYLMKSSKSTVVNNQIFNTLINSDKTETLGAGAISISGSPYTIVENNFIDGSGMYGIVSDYSFGSQFLNNTIQNTVKSGAYFINMNDVIISGNTFKKIGELVLKGYFENTSLQYIKDQMRIEKYKNLDTGNNFVITKNKFYSDKDILYFVGTPADPSTNYPGNQIKNNVVTDNQIFGPSRNQDQLINFRQANQSKIKIKNNKVINKSR